MMIMKKTVFRIGVAFVLIFIIVLSIINVKYCRFWSFNVGTALTLIVALCFAFMGSQYFSDERKTKENVERLIFKLQSEVNKDSFSKVTSDINSEELRIQHTMTTRRISNLISTLEKSAATLHFGKEIEYINAEFRSYRELFDEHISDIGYLVKSESTFKNHAEKIDSKCDEIIGSLYLKQRKHNKN